MWLAGLCVAGGAGLLGWWWRTRPTPDVMATVETSVRASWVPGDALPVLSGEALLKRSSYARLVQSILHKTGLSTENNERDIAPILHAYAQFVQMLPASESHHHAQPGGLLQHTLEVVDYALSYRRAYMLPVGAGAERVNELKHVWTSGVLLAALFHDLGKPMSDVRVVLYGPKIARDGQLWHPIAGDMLLHKATHYTVVFNETRRYDDHKALPLILMQRLVPRHVMAWMSSQDADMLSQLLKNLSDGGSGILGELVKKADMESTRLNLLDGPRTRFVSAKEVPLISILDEALCRLIQSGRLRFNVPGGHGFVWGAAAGGEGDLLLVCPRIVDEVRKYLQEGLVAGSRGIPTDNLIVYGTWMDYSRIRSLPAASRSDGSAQPARAVWRVEVEGIPTPLTVIRFPRNSPSLQQLADVWPSEFQGEISAIAASIVSQELQQDSGGQIEDVLPQDNADTQVKKSNRAGQRAGAVEVGTAALPARVSSELPDFLLELDAGPVAPLSMAAAHAKEAQAVADIQSRDGLTLEDEGQGASLASKLMLVSGPAPSTARSAASSTKTNTPQMRIKEQKKTELIEQFEDWLRLGLKSGHLKYNGAKAMVHFYKPQTDADANADQDADPVALFVSPALYQSYVKELQPEKWAETKSLAEIPRPAWLPIQSALLKAHAHRKEQQGKINRSVFRFATKGGGVFNANVMTQPRDIFDIMPEANPYIAGEMAEVGVSLALRADS